jgi:hypothetical protein
MFFIKLKGCIIVIFTLRGWAQIINFLKLKFKNYITYGVTFFAKH